MKRDNRQYVKMLSATVQKNGRLLFIPRHLPDFLTKKVNYIPVVLTKLKNNKF